MKTIKKLGVLAMLFIIKVDAMYMSQEGRARFQGQWQKQKQLSVKEQQKDRFQQLLEPDHIGKGWFQGPNEIWEKKVIFSAFEKLDPSTHGFKYLSNGFNNVYSSIFNAVCKAISDYDKTCYFHDYDTRLTCKEIFKKLDNLIKYSITKKKLEPTFANAFLFSQQFEGQKLYEEFIAEKEKRNNEDED